MTDRYSYSIKAGELLIIEKEKGSLFWKGKPKQMDVKKILPLQGSDDCIVLLDVFQADAKQTRNLLRCDPSGRIIWESGLPSMMYGIKRSDHESYVNVKFENNIVIGTSSSGFVDYIEVENGNIIKSIFVK